ncbi:MAG: hypothetical protein Q7J68_08645 [Thermoplasmata archaeon]|nr:hypothetical protein [Thermoplasmata archaeon]
MADYQQQSAIIKGAELMRELPEGWEWATIDAVVDDVQYGYTAKAKDNGPGPRYLRITDIQNGSVNWNEVPYCDIDDTDIPHYKLNSGDIVFARTGATTGKSFLIKGCPDSIFASYLIRLHTSSVKDAGSSMS